MATTTHLSMVRGDSKLFRVTVKDADGNVVNILGYDASFTVRENPLDTTSVISKTEVAGITAEKCETVHTSPVLVLHWSSEIKLSSS